MELVNHEVLKEYNKWIDELSDENALYKDCVISIVDLLNAHFSLIDYFFENGELNKSFVNIGLRNKKLLSSVVASQIEGYTGDIDWERKSEKCATLFYGLIKNQPFHGCNKRTALLTLLYYLAKANRAPTASHKELEIITLIIASNTIRDRSAFKPYSKFEDGEIRFLAQYLQKNTRPIDIRSYSITYNELNIILGNFGFFLNNPHGNSIDIIRLETQSSLFGLPKKRKKHTRVGVIGFSGWTREVAKNEMKLLREYTGLTAKEDFDSQIVYTGVPPLSSLINYYSQIFKCLEKK